MVRRRVWVSSPFHNYADRRKVTLTEDDINEFKFYEENNTHWNHGDFINASCVTICNIPLSVPPNYMILYNGNQIESRWYVMDYTYMSGEPNKNSKYQASLMRDVVIDFRSNIDMELFDCKRGNLRRDIWDPFLVKSEGIALNEVKKDQKNIVTWDNNTQWLTILYDVTANVADRTIEFEPAPESDFSFADMQQQFSSRGFTLADTGSTNMFFRQWDRINSRVQFTFSRWGAGHPIPTARDYTFACDVIINRNGTMTNNGNEVLTIGSGTLAANETIARNFARSVIERIQIGSTATNSINNTFDYDRTNDFNELSNRFDTRLVSGSVVDITTANDTTSSVNNSFNQLINDNIPWTTYNQAGAQGTMIGAITIALNRTISNSTIHNNLTNFITAFSELPESGEMILPNDNRLDEIHLGCVTIPFGTNTSINFNGNTYQVSEQVLKSLATVGWTNIGTAIKDIQILPYCPSGVLNSFSSGAAASDVINLNVLPTDIASRDIIPMTSTNEGTIYYGIACRQSSMSYTYPVDFSNWFGSDIKLDSITKKVRLVSHNHAQYFEFKPTSNIEMTGITLSYTIRPQSTIFRITPIFKGLYGSDFKDARGLVWEGGVSLPQITAAWTEHVLQNSTYRQVFDREMYNLDITQNNQRQLEVLHMETNRANDMTNLRVQQIRLGASTGAGALVGGLKGGPVGAALGGAAGAALGAVSLSANREIMDRNYAAARQSLSINDAQRNENAAYKADIWNLNNQAIQSRPSTMLAGTEVSTIFNNKAYFELYDCTPEEKQEVELKLRYNGMTIGRKGRINDFIQNDGDYIQGVMVFNQGMTPKICNAINAELAEGCYIEKTNETETIQ